MKKTVPALLTDKKEKLEEMMQTCASFTDFVQVDIMDGEFVSSSSVTMEDIQNMKCPTDSEAHLMVKNPLQWVDAFKKFGSNRILFHIEIDQDPLFIIENIKKKDIKAGIAVNPGTKISDFEHLIDKVDAVLFMSVIPGFYGAPFIPDVLDKIKQVRQKYPDVCLGIDGGVKLTNAAEIAKTGVDYICVGSAILKADSPGQAYTNFQELINE